MLLRTLCLSSVSSFSFALASQIQVVFSSLHFLVQKAVSYFLHLKQVLKVNIENFQMFHCQRPERNREGESILDGKTYPPFLFLFNILSFLAILHLNTFCTSYIINFQSKIFLCNSEVSIGLKF